MPVPFSSSLAQLSCEPVLREQIELLWRYQLDRVELDPEFLGRHAQMIVQLARCMQETAAAR